MQIPQLSVAGSSRSARTLAGLFLAVCLAGCLERNNPFDPLNQSSPLVAEIRNRNRATLDSLALVGLEVAKSLDGVLDGYRADSLRNAHTADTNAARRTANDRTADANESTEEANARATVFDSLWNKDRFVSLESLRRFGPYPSLDSVWLQLQGLVSRAEDVMIRANEEARPIEVYPRAYRDSVLGSLRRDYKAFTTLRALVDAADREVIRANEDILAYNLSMDNQNHYVNAYNSEITFRRVTRNREILTHPDSLRLATGAAQAGDTLYLGPGTFPVDLRFSSGSPGNSIVIRGYPGGRTILRPREEGGQQAGIVTGSHLRFEDLVFRGGSSSGIKLSGGSRGVVFERCVFDSNGTWGVDAAGADLHMKDCEVRANVGGMRVEMITCGDCVFSLENVLVVRNGGTGIEAAGTTGTIVNSTFADNGAEGLRITNHNRSLNVFNSIFSGNGQYGLTRDATFDYQQGLLVRTTNFWANGETGDSHWNLANVDSSLARTLMDGNLNLDPGFVDPPAFDYGLRPGSPLTDFVIIGYRRKL